MIRNFPVSHFVKLSYNVFSAHIHNFCEHGSWSNHTTFLWPLLLFFTFWVYIDEPSWATGAHATMKHRDRCTGRHILNTLVLYYYLFVFVTNVSRENIIGQFDEMGHRKIGKLQFEWQFDPIFKWYLLHVSTLSYYSVELIMSCCNNNFYMSDLLLKPMQLFKFSKLETSVM
jgi:hypothetical protein